MSLNLMEMSSEARIDTGISYCKESMSPSLWIQLFSNAVEMAQEIGTVDEDQITLSKMLLELINDRRVKNIYLRGYDSKGDKLIIDIAYAHFSNQSFLGISNHTCTIYPSLTVIIKEEFASKDYEILRNLHPEEVTKDYEVFIDEELHPIIYNLLTKPIAQYAHQVSQK